MTVIKSPDKLLFTYYVITILSLMLVTFASVQTAVTIYKHPTELCSTHALQILHPYAVLICL